MASLGLKIYYLRTREKKMNQQEVADALGIRQGTVSYIENDLTTPQWPLLVDLCQFFDVTPTFLADEERGVVPSITERWGLRDALVTGGMSVELPEAAITDLGDGRVLCRLEPGADYYDDEAAEIRCQHKSRASSRKALERRRAEEARRERALETELEQDREKHPRRRRRGD